MFWFCLKWLYEIYPASKLGHLYISCMTALAPHDRPLSFSPDQNFPLIQGRCFLNERKDTPQPCQKRKIQPYKRSCAGSLPCNHSLMPINRNIWGLFGQQHSQHSTNANAVFYFFFFLKGCCFLTCLAECALCDLFLGPWWLDGISMAVLSHDVCIYLSTIQTLKQ